MKKYICIFIFLLGVMGCESLEDTYSDMAGDGPRRYLGKCTDLKVVVGWERLRVSWVNAIDPVVKNIRITWSSTTEYGDTLLPRESTSCDIPRLSDGNYEIRVSGVDDKGNASTEIIGYGRPYTMNHEVVLSFSQVISKYIFVDDRLVLFFEEMPENISDIVLKYTNSDGVKKELPLGKEEIGKKYMLLPEAIRYSETDSVVLERKGYIDDSFDVIPLPEYKLERKMTMSMDFKMALEAKYMVEIDEDFVQREDLQLDYSLNSFEDILYFPNLKTLYLGKNRFLWDSKAGGKDYDILQQYNSASEVYDLDKSLWVLDKAHELFGLEVKLYNKHYIPSEQREYLEKLPNPQPAERVFSPTNDWNITCSVEDIGDYNSYLDHLFDGDLNSAWQPELNTMVDTYQIIIDMKAITSVRGLQIAQRRFNPRTERSYLNLMPSLISVEGSINKIHWSYVSGVEGNIIGNTVGEITEIVFPHAQEVRYLRFTVSDLPYGSNYAITLGEIRVF